MELQLVSFVQAKTLKELGFPQRTRDYDKWYSQSGMVDNFTNQDTTNSFAPTLELVAKWLRDEKGLHIEILYRKNHYVIDFREYDTYYVSNSNKVFQFNSYEEALSVGIDKALEILKMNNCN